MNEFPVKSKPSKALSDNHTFTYTYHPNGQLKSETWRTNHVLHKLNGPAIQEWNEEGKLIGQAWYFNGVLQSFS
tara:strand:+ start:333 stop:554 length:222 start_codon:yes stop_codon:yes gene_type:complete